MGPVMFWLALRPGLKRFREELEGEGVEALAYMDDVSRPYGGHGQHAKSLCLPPARARRRWQWGQVSTAKMVAPPSKRNAPTAEEMSLLESVDVHVVGEGRVFPDRRTNTCC